MNSRRITSSLRVLSLACLSVLLFSACGGGGGSSPGGNPTPLPPGTVGPSGGTVTGASGGQVVVPAGALGTNVTLSITQSNTGAPALPAGHVTVGNMFAFTPHGTAFASPVTITIPFDPAQLPAGQTLHLLKTNAAQTGWEDLSGITISGGNVSASVTGFSHVVATHVPPPTEAQAEPARYYRFDGIDIEGVHVELDGNWDDIETGTGAPEGELLATQKFGDLPFIPPGMDIDADGEVFSTADGVTYWVDTEAPSGDLLAQIPEETYLGSRTMLRIDQSYRKNAADAKLSLVVSQATLDLIENNPPGPREAGCPWSKAISNGPTDCKDLLMAELELEITVFDGSEKTRNTKPTFTAVHSIRGSVVHWFNEPPTASYATFVDSSEVMGPGGQLMPRYTPPWKAADFFPENLNSLLRVRLTKPLRIPLDLSSLPTCEVTNPPQTECPEFTVRVWAKARTVNRRSGETYAHARFRDPLETDGLVVEAEGLTPTNAPLIGFVPVTPVPLECNEADHVDSGTLEFTASTYRIVEFGQPRQEIAIVRKGGTHGDLVARVGSHNVTALAGTHYTPVNQTLFFPNGDDTPQIVRVPTITNTTNDGNVTLDLELSAEPGCARLGDPTVARVTIIDDEARPVPLGPSGALDPTFDVDGKVTTAPFGGPDSRMIQQPDGKFLIVGGTFTDFVMARFNADGSPDTGFGDSGRLTTDISGGVLTEHARAVALQPDGKIIVAGDGTLPNNDVAVAIARFTADGKLDLTFSGDGKFLDPAVLGRAFAVAVQTDGKIVVAGDFPVSGNANDFGDMMVARLNADGTLDSSFGTSGLRITDVTAGTDLARNVLVLPNGSILAAGDPISNGTYQTGVIQLDASGNFDTSFNTTGKLAIPGAHLGRGLARQPDGKLLLAGGTATFPSSFAVARLNADGSYDASFGNGGAVTTSLSNSTSGAGDTALAVAVATDGKIYAAGTTGSMNNNFGLARYTAAGVLDTSFAGVGFINVDFNGLKDQAESVVIQGDGRIVLGGVATPTSSDGYGLLRVNP